MCYTKDYNTGAADRSPQYAKLIKPKPNKIQTFFFVEIKIMQF